MRLPDEGLGVKGASGFASSVRARFHPRSSPAGKTRRAAFPLSCSLGEKSLLRQGCSARGQKTGLRLPATRAQPAERGGGGGGVSGGNGAEVKRVRGREVLVGS